MFYGTYRKLQDSSWRCLADFKIDALPIDVLKIARAAGIKVIKNSTVNVLEPNVFGRSYYNGKKWFIVYDDTRTLEQKRFTVAHELGHIFLGHELIYGKYPQTVEFMKKPKSEQQADMFAIRLLCPACVLWGLDLHSADDIARYCLVDPDTAMLRAKRMKELYGRDKFLMIPLEKTVYENFKPYIEITKRT